jgi:hypothetical protein
LFPRGALARLVRQKRRTPNRGGEMAEKEEQGQQPEKHAGSDRQSAPEKSPGAVKEDHSLKVHGDKYERLIPKDDENR